MKQGLFVGLCTRDIVYYIDKYPDENHKVKTEHYDSYIGGPAANAAITYAVLGGQATLVTCLGRSDEAHRMIAELESYGIQVINCAQDEVLPHTAAIAVSPSGERTIFSGQHLFKEIEIGALGSYEFALFDLNQQQISLDILEQIDAKSVILDAGSWKENTEKFIERADIIIASEQFRNPQGETPIEMSIYHGKKVAVTRGERDILYDGRTIPVPQVQVVDTLGAGDIFHGAFCYGYYELKLNMNDALSYAARIASESVRHKGPRKWMATRDRSYI